MGRQIDIYNAYLARWKQEHPNVVEPTVPADRDAFASEVWADKGKVVLQHGARYWGAAGPACPVYRLSDGRVVEETRGAQGTFRSPLYAVFKNQDEWRAYERPAPIHIYFEQW